MSGFSADWLKLREPFDRAARNTAVERAAAAWRLEREGSTLQVLDLGAGTGSNFRALAPKLAPPQDWLLLDDDASLLARVEAETRRWAAARGGDLEAAGGAMFTAGCSIRCVRFDLARDLAHAAQQADLLCAAALFDLVSAAWFETLAECVCDAFYGVLTYNGRIEWQPPDPWDEPARRLVNRHQLGDKGFGPALGPRAPAVLARTLRDRGFDVVSGHSDWSMAAADKPIQLALLEGWRRAISELAPSPDADAWAARRRRQIGAGRSRLRVGHVDIFARKRRLGL